MIEQKRLQVWQLEEARALAESRELLGRLGQVEELRRALARWRAVAIALVALGAGVALWLLLGR